MTGPWEKYQQQPAGAGPWTRYAEPKAAPASPVDDMSPMQRFGAAVGQGANSTWNAVKQALDAGAVALERMVPGGEAISRATGGRTAADIQREKNQDIAEAAVLDAPLLATTAGKVGSFVGKAGSAAPTMLIPGVNTYTGSALVGAGTGALTTEGDLEERAKGAAFGGLGGLGGKALGDAIGAGARALSNRATQAGAQKAAQNASRDSALAAGREAGYAVTPSQAGTGGIVNSALEGLGGKVKTQQAASVRNQAVTNNLARKALGLPDDAPITAEALDALRADAGRAYQAVAELGKFDATRSRLPASVSVEEGISPLLAGKTRTVDAAELVRAWKQANADATAYFRAYGRDANPETLAKAKLASSAAKDIDGFIEAQLQQLGRSDLGKALKEARVLIAKSYSVENALANQVGDVAATKLAAQLAKGKPLSGELKTAAQFAGAFPKAAQSNVDVPAWSILDMVGAGAAGASGASPLAALFAARPVARAAVLTPAYQKLMATPSYGPGLATRTAPLVLDTELAREVARLTGTRAGIEAAR